MSTNCKLIKLESMVVGQEFIDSELTTDAKFINGEYSPLNFTIIGDHIYTITNLFNCIVIAEDHGNGHGKVRHTIHY